MKETVKKQTLISNLYLIRQSFQWFLGPFKYSVLIGSEKYFVLSFQIFLIFYVFCLFYFIFFSSPVLYLILFYLCCILFYSILFYSTTYILFLYYISLFSTLQPYPPYLTQLCHDTPIFQ